MFCETSKLGRSIRIAWIKLYRLGTVAIDNTAAGLPCTHWPRGCRCLLRRRRQQGNAESAKPMVERTMNRRRSSATFDSDPMASAFLLR